MRGMFTAGVLDVLMEHGLTTDGTIGVSAGAVFGCNFKSHQIGRVIRYNTEYCNDKRYASFRNLLRTGNLYSEDFCYHEVPEKLDPFDEEAFRASPMDFFVVCTDLHTGDPIYHKCRSGDAEDVRWMEASASMPLAAKTVRIGHYSLLDGGVAEVTANVFTDNETSARVLTRVGFAYEGDGMEWSAGRGAAAPCWRYRLTRERREAAKARA